jgi:protein CpxP
MKRKFILFIAILIAGAITVNAQGGFQRRTVEERVKAVLEKLEPFKLDAAKKAEVDSIFTQLYKAMDVKIEEMRASGTFDREAMRTEREKAAAARDEKLKKIFTEEEFKKWKEEIEPSLRSQRTGGRNN